MGTSSESRKVGRGGVDGLYSSHLSSRKFLLQVFAWLAFTGWDGMGVLPSVSLEMLCLLLKVFGLKECVGRGQSSASGNC